MCIICFCPFNLFSPDDDFGLRWFARTASICRARVPRVNTFWAKKSLSRLNLTSRSLRNTSLHGASSYGEKIFRLKFLDPSYHRLFIFSCDSLRGLCFQQFASWSTDPLTDQSHTYINITKVRMQNQFAKTISTLSGESPPTSCSIAPDRKDSAISYKLQQNTTF